MALPENRAAETPAEAPGETAGAQPAAAPETGHEAALPTAPASPLPPAPHIEDAGQQPGQNEPPAASQAAVAPPTSDPQSAAARAPLPTPTPVTDTPPAEAQPIPPQPEKVTTRPLSEEHKGEQARPAQADAARCRRGIGSSSRTLERQALLAFRSPSSRRLHAATVSCPKRTGGESGTDAISALFRQRAVRQALAQDQQQSTASLGPLSLGTRDASDTPDEIRDVYTHSLPDAGDTPAAAWREFSLEKRNARPRRAATRRAQIRRKSAAGSEDASQATANRKQAVSDVLAGGL